ncbi:MAG TPA: Uma2 family endonuclease [Gemmataceae bacterium]|nr:Uma2 family endonuclease [Gemmataceae bacterium]
MSTQGLPVAEVVYPESDGQPIGENTLQVKWIVALYNGFEALFRDTPDVFVAADLFWYPVQGDPSVVTAPDVMVVFGRPKGDRGSYKQWEEGDVAPQVVFEILSPSNDYKEMQKKFRLYQQHGVEEYYVYDPDRFGLDVWVQTGSGLQLSTQPHGFTSRWLGVTFQVPGTGPMRITQPDGRPFLTYLELLAQAEADQQRATDEARKAQEERQKAEEERRKAEEERQKAERLATKLRALGVDPDAV